MVTKILRFVLSEKSSVTSQMAVGFCDASASKREIHVMQNRVFE